jgi:hypothetical protein
MEIGAIIILVVAFLALQRWRNSRLRNSTSDRFSIWFTEYSQSTAFTRAVIAQTYVTQVMVLVKQESIFDIAEYNKIESMFKDSDPQQIIEVVDRWVNTFLPYVTEELGVEAVKNSPASYIGLLMFLANTNVNPASGVQRYLLKKQSSYI